MLKRILLCSTILIGLSACDQIKFPVYWFCEGKSYQSAIVDNSNPTNYVGKDPVLLELFQGHMYQFFSPALAGSYIKCSSINGLLIFRMSNCLSREEKNYFREIILNTNSGTLIFIEYRNKNNFKVVGHGDYQCKFLGTSYIFKPFNHV